MYSLGIWYRGFYDIVYSRAISINCRCHFLNLTTVITTKGLQYYTGQRLFIVRGKGVRLYIFCIHLIVHYTCNPVLSTFLTYHQLCTKRNTKGVTCETGTAHPSGAPKFTPGFNGICLPRSLVLCVLFCRSLFVILYFLFCPFVCPSIYGF